MATQASLDVTGGTSVDASWGDSVAANLPTTETATPSTVFEGKLWTRTDEDRLYCRDGSSGNVPVLHYSSSGRIYCVVTPTASGVGSGSVAQPSLTTVADPLGMNVGWNGTHYILNVSHSGLWTIAMYVAASSTGSGIWYARGLAGSYAYHFDGAPGNGVFGCGSITVPLSANDDVWMEVYQASGGAVNLASCWLTMTRIGA